MNRGHVLLLTAFCAMTVTARAANEIGFVEKFSLADDRAGVLEQLVPGTEDYYYFHCLYYQHTGDYRRFHETLNQWIRRYRYTARVREMQNRQALLEYSDDPDRSLAHIRDRLNLHFSHQKRVLEKTTHHPTSLDQTLFSREALTARAYRDHDKNLHGFEDTGLLYLDGRKLSDDRRRDLLKRLTRPDFPHLPELVVQDLRYRHSGGFGSIDIHNKLLLAQLDACLKLMPELIANTNFINTYLTRLHPSADADWRHNPAEHEAFLDRLWAFASRLPPVQNSLKAHVLFHRLDFDRARGVYDHDRFMTYLRLPRNVAYVEPAYLQRPENRHVHANLNAAFDAYTLLARVVNDEPLVRDYLAHVFKDADGYRVYADYVNDAYLKRLYAETKIVNGVGDMEQWYSLLSPQEVKELKERVDIEFLPTHPDVFGRDDPVQLDLAVKNVQKLIVKIYEINTRNYYRQHLSEISTGVDLDGLVANTERTVTYNAVPLRRHVERFTFPEIDRPGVFVIEFIGNGRSSRALVRKGSLTFTERIGAGGHVFSVYDERNRKLDDCRLWLSGHEYGPDRNGDIAVPYSNERGQQPIILTHAGFSVLRKFQHLAEAYRLDAGCYIDRESLVDGRQARLLVRPLLTVNNMPIDIKLLEDVTLTLRTTDLDGIGSSLEIEDFELFNERESVYEFNVPPNLSHLVVTLRGRVRNLSQTRDEDLETVTSLAINQIDKTEKTEDLLLRRVAGAYVLAVLGKTGESRADRAVHVNLKHRDFRRTVDCTLQTDAAGRIRLGALRDIERLQARDEHGVAHTWQLTQDRRTYPPAMHATTRLPLKVPLMHGPLAASYLAFSLLEVRNGVFVKDWSDRAAIEAGYLTLQNLPAGDYDLLLRQSGDRIRVKLTDGPLRNRYAQSDSRHLEVREILPLQIASVTRDAHELVVRLAHPGPAARVHVVGTRFVPAFSPFEHLNALSEPGLAANRIEPPESRYVSGRNIGDEYRYILERRYAKQFPGNMLNRPSLILNPWSPRKTDTGTEEAEEGEAWSDDKRDQAGLYGSRQPGARGGAAGAVGGPVDFSSLDFLPSGSVVLPNLEADRDGVVRVAIDKLGPCQQVHVLAVDGWNTVYRETTLDDRDESYRDLRLTRPLDPEKHFAEKKAVSPVLPGSQLVIDDITTSEMEVYDTLGKVYGLFMTLTGDETLAEFGFILNWPELAPARKRELYSEYACHELNLFLFHKDPAFFKAVIQPYLRNKKDKTFMDDWFIAKDLTPYFRPWRYQRLNMMERVLLGKRVAEERAAMQRHVGDRFDLVPPDIERFNRLFRTALQGRALEAGDAFGWDAAKTEAETTADLSDAFGGQAVGFKSGAMVRSPVLMRKVAEESARRKSEPPASAKPASAPAREMGLAELAQADGELKEMDRLRRQDAEHRAEARIFYRKLDKTREWVENNYYHQPIEAQLDELIAVNAFWKDYAAHTGDGPFLSPSVAEATHNFTEMLCALAVLDLPFKATEHDTQVDAARMLLLPGSPMMVFHKQIKEAPVAQDRPDLLVSQSYFAQDDRYRYEANERFDKFVTREFLAARVYGAQVVLTNPTSSPRKVDVLLQVPPGAVPVLNGFYTRGLHRRLEAYSTQTLEYYFYFPLPGSYTQFPVHVAENEVVVGDTKPFTFNVVPKLTEIDKTAWPYISQYGSDEDVLAYLREHNIDRLNLDEIAFRMRDRDFFMAVTPLLRKRHVYNHTLWSYGIYHKDVPTIRTYLQHAPYATQCGLYIDSVLLTLDPIERHVYQHKEYWPLVNARVYPLGGKRKILNDQFFAQYIQFLAFLAYRPELDTEDRLGVVTYLLLQDRVEEALRMVDDVDTQDTEMALQVDAMRAYLAFSRGDPAAARRIAARYQDHPVDRWRQRFGDILAQVEEIEGGAARVIDEEDRMQQQTRLADTAPSLDIKVENREIELHFQNLEACRINYYPVDIELLFSRNPFVQDEGSQFSIVRPDRTDRVKLPGKGMRTIDLPAAYHDRNVMVEVTGGGITRAQAYYPHSLAVQVSENYGQVRLAHAGTGEPVVQAYIKVYARMKDGGVRFYKDGYTDLRGRFDYTSLNTNELEFVDRFALLIMSDSDGAVVREAAPPKR